ncbi:disease resistance protein L6-like [Syzygium oleosum]|uniref:disease resistance protein L6-like n=1 Tax=Syzygium oleosum TaxID=219896 RepID=UPI0024B9A82A|nr:disease resistance protein L6-like [Syzygium oleosum]
MESLEAGTSSEYEYQVFLNFRGPDTRKGFTGCLYHSLIDTGICVFRDSEKLHVGERIDGALQRAIDKSRIYIPIFSRNYASSQWCLRELAQIVESTFKSNGNKEILPIFFDVEPDVVKMKTPLYGNAILNLERKKPLSTEEIESWRKALKEVAAIKGWEVEKYNDQGQLIKLVVEEVVDKLKMKQKPVTEHLIGIDDRVGTVRNMLDVDSGGVRFIQIYGMGGIGKTTLAKVVFNQLCTHFGKCCCFLEDVREKSSRTDGLVELQKKLLSEIGNVAGTTSINEIDYGMKRIEETLRNKKVFIVLDDVDKSEQVKKLVGKGALCSGSRVLITTRNKDVLQITGPKYDILDYEMEVMSSDYALQLFSKHAFKKDSPSDDRYDISKKIVSTTGRLPLTIEVIGSFLFRQTQELWEETLDKLSKALLEDVYKKLRISFDALTFEQRQIFLDIACFFIGEEKTNAIHMWRDCDFFPISGIAVLNNMSLIKIVKDNKFWMHDQLRDLGREIVRQENPTNPEERSRLWIQEEVLSAISSKKTKNNVRAIELNLDVPIRSEEIRKFENLRFLRLHLGTFVGDLTDCFPELRWIYWRYPSPPYEMTNMRLNNLVILEFSSVHFIDDQKLFNLIKEARKLKVLSFENCQEITRIPDSSGCSTLERLTFRGCHGLGKIDGSIGKLKCLKELKFDDCPQLKGLPEEIMDLRNLERFSLKCFFFGKCCEMKELPDAIFKLKSLRKLKVSILGPVGLLGAIGKLELSGAIGKLENLEVLRVKGNLKGQIPYEIGLLPRLQKLVLEECYEIRELPALPISLTHLTVPSTSLQVVPDLSNLTNLVELDLSDNFHMGRMSTSDFRWIGRFSNMGRRDRILTGDLRWIGRLSKLEQLRLGLPHVPTPTELASLPKLNRLLLSGLDLQTFTQVPSSLLELTLENFNSIALHSFNLKNLSDLRLFCSQMQEIQLDGLHVPNLTMLYVENCGPLERFMLSSMRKLKEVAMGECPKLDEIHIAGVLESLEKLNIFACESFRRFVFVDTHWESSHESSLILASRVFNKLRCLWLQDCDKILSIQVVGMSESLEDLRFYGHHLQSVCGLSNLKYLKSFDIDSAPELRIVEGLDELKFLSNLRLMACLSLESLIDVSTTQLPNDCHVYIFCCPKLRGVKQGFTGSIQRFKRYKEEESVPAAFTDPLMVWHAEGSAQEGMHLPGNMEELLAPSEEPQEPSSVGTCTCCGGLFFFWSKFGGLFCFKDH